MDPVLFVSFIAATLLIVASPGPSVALASARAVKYGRRAALLAVAGDALGTVVHILVAVASLSILVSLAEMVLPALQIAGGIFILYLAWQSCVGCETDAHAPVAASDRSSFFAGFFACVTNPKAIVFFVALFPGFLSPDHSIGLQSLIYGAIFITLDAAFIFGYALLATHLVHRTLAPHLSVDRLSAFGLFGVGSLLIYKGWRDLPDVT